MEVNKVLPAGVNARVHRTSSGFSCISGSGKQRNAIWCKVSRTSHLIAARIANAEILRYYIIPCNISITVASINIAVIVCDIEEPSLDNVCADVQSDGTVACPLDSINESIEPFIGKVVVLVHDVVAVIQQVHFTINNNSVILFNVLEVLVGLNCFT